MPTVDPSGFRFPGGDDRTTLIGATGSGKTTCAAWLFSHQRFDRRPWIIVDFKREALFDEIGIPPLEPLHIGSSIPKRPGGYILTPGPDENDELEQFLWRVWERENTGLFVDEAALMPDKPAWQAILQQGRSKRIPCIICTQRPVMVKRAVFSEASFFCVYRMQDRRDAQVIQGFVPADLSLPLPERHWRWYDVAKNRLLTMGPVPPPEKITDRIRAELPHEITLFHDFTRRPGRPPMRRKHA